MRRKLRTEQHGVFPGVPNQERFQERDKIVGRVLAKRAGLPLSEHLPYENLGNRELPVHKKKGHIQRAIRDHQVSMVDGATGSGKSTQIAQYALEMGYKKIVYLEPRVLLADNLADRIEVELGEQLGREKAESLIGVRHSERSTGRGKQIEIMTPATYLRVKQELAAFKDHPVLIVGDEIHEKDFETELAVAASVGELHSHPKWRLVLASATLDAQSIHNAYSTVNGRTIPRISIEGRPHDLAMLEEPTAGPVETYLRHGQDHDKVMIFTAGKAEIKDIINGLRAAGVGNARINQLHAKLSYEDIRKATHARLREGERQIIVATSAGQSGLTIPGLTLVISDGTTRRPDLDDDGTPGLFKELCAQDELTQQAGRAGRDMAGGVFVLSRPEDPSSEFYSFDSRPRQSPAQIYHTNISRNVLLASSLETNFYELNKYLIHKVDHRTILEAYEVLYRLSAHDEFNIITEIGRTMNKFPLRPELSRVMVAAMIAGAGDNILRHLVAITSCIEGGGLPYFERGVGRNWKKDIRRSTNDDYIAQLDMFYATREHFDHSRVDEKALQERNYDPKNTYRAHKTFDKILRTLGIDEHTIDITPPTEEDEDLIRDFLTAGLFDFAHQKVGSSGRATEFASLHERHEPTPRQLSNRGTYQGSDEIVIGMPRRFEKYVKGELLEHSVIENVFPTSVQKLTKHVLHLLQRKPVTSSRVVGGRLRRTDERYFGTALVDEVDSISRLTHTDETRAQLREAAYKKPTQALEELVAVKKELEQLIRITPFERQLEFFPKGIMSDEWLNDFMDQLIDGEVDSIYLLDNKLRSHMVLDAISIDNWIAESKKEELKQLSPEYISLSDGVEYRLYYTHGKPIINHFNLHHADDLPEQGLFLDDGREVFINYRIGRNTKRHSAQAIKDYVSQLDSWV